MFKKNCLLILFFIFVLACSKEPKKVDNILNETKVEDQMVVAYKEGIKALQEGDSLFASKKFNEAELLFPQSVWAPKSSLMSAYSLYLYDYYGEAIYNLERHLIQYPLDPNTAYVYYLMAICYFEQTDTEKTDLKLLLKSKEFFEIIINQYPDTDFALDSKYKLELILDIMAAKEMYIGRYYMKTEKWIAAINRFQNVIKYYDETPYIEEALHRLVEVYYKIGLIDDAKAIASVLGYNYGSSEWYKKSYIVFNKDYKKKKNRKKTIFSKKKNKDLV